MVACKVGSSDAATAVSLGQFDPQCEGHVRKEGQNGGYSQDLTGQLVRVQGEHKTKVGHQKKLYSGAGHSEDDEKADQRIYLTS